MTEKRVKPILVVRPGAGADAMRAMVEAAGYLMIEGEPDDFRVVEILPVTPASVDAITRAALEAIKGASFSSVQADFGERLAKALTEPTPFTTKANPKPKKRQAAK